MLYTCGIYSMIVYYSIYTTGIESVLYYCISFCEVVWIIIEYYSLCNLDDKVLYRTTCVHVLHNHSIWNIDRSWLKQVLYLRFFFYRENLSSLYTDQEWNLLSTSFNISIKFNVIFMITFLLRFIYIHNKKIHKILFLWALYVDLTISCSYEFIWTKNLILFILFCW